MIELDVYRCTCCTGTFYVPPDNTARSPELCPFCGSSSECDLTGTLKVEVVQPKKKGKKP